MKATELIRKARKAGRSALTEVESKQLLQHYDVPVVDEAVATSMDELFLKAERKAYPLVLKGLGTRLTHKTERGLVKLNLKRL